MDKPKASKTTVRIPRSARNTPAAKAMLAAAGGETAQAALLEDVAPKAKAKAPASMQVVIAPMQLEIVQLTLVGDSPLIMHRWSDKAKQQMLGKQQKLAKAAKEAKDPWRDFNESLYFMGERPDPAETTPENMDQYEYGFPAHAFKGAAVDACSHVDGITKVLARGAFHVLGDHGTDLVQIKGVPQMREDMVRVGMGTADIRYRGEFREWEATVSVRLNRNVMSHEQLLNLFNVAGFAVGLGDWRPAKDGSFGMFHAA